MKLKSLVFLAALLMVVPAVLAQDGGAPDSMKLVVLSGTPQVGLPTQPFVVACSVFADANALGSISMGWKWDYPELVMDSAKAVGDFLVMDIASFYLNDNRALTNDSQVALCSGVDFGSGFPTNASWRQVAVYYMTLSNWSASRAAINIDSIQILPDYAATEYFFVGVASEIIYPIWGGPINISTLGVDESDLNNIPSTFELEQNYPNPFNPTTNIKYGLPAKSHMTLKIYNLLGQEINTLVDQIVPAGTHETEWNGRDKTGAEVASGIYFYKLVAGDFVQTKKMMLVK
ncbi:MAG TPA: T9SS type A sorting domain-containing protein [candidate division Zixibacteria bacterium]|nr:T9SS type A sorting domain-containing protein [candidate division Zixibacteria bacterium]